MAMAKARQRLMRRRYNTQPSNKTMVGLRYKISRSKLALMYCNPKKSR